VTPQKSLNYSKMNLLELMLVSHQLTQDLSTKTNLETLGIHLHGPEQLHHLSTSNSQGL
jgi:hypothetical protein